MIDLSNIDFVATTIALLTIFGIWSIMAISLNLEYGVAGIPNFGQALFVSLGAYTTGVMYSRVMPLLAGHDALDPCDADTLASALQLRSDIAQSMPVATFVTVAIALVVAMFISGLVGYVMSLITLRLKEEWFLALVLLVGGEIIRILVRGYKPIICANSGIAGIAQPFRSITDDTQLGTILFMVMVLVLALIVYWYSERLIRSPYGRLLKAVRENDAVAQSLGKDVVRIRARVMFIGSAIAAVAGVLFALNLGLVSTNDFVVTLTLDVWVMVVLGGLGNMRGALLGAAVITLLRRVTQVAAIQLNQSGVDLEFNFVRFILLGIILLIMLRYRPQGLLPESRRTTVAHDALLTDANK
ncbi:MAG: branched-chain amino acid ABC transporter permease [Chloroflexi bacterium]|nr:MAG: branched-chain amino acid ABC transporter permease [Chloroflexota bacterium]